MATIPTITEEFLSDGLGAFDELVRLGSGTYGTTFRAVRGDDEYAIKVIHFPDMPEYLWRREITALQRVEHPNVVTFRNSGYFEVQGTSYPFLECEFIEGGSADRLIAEGNRPTSGDELRAFLTGLLSGVGEIHELGIIHRDIKPGNVALRGHDWGEPVLLDFGLARVLDMSTHTVYPHYIGTFRYMSPEQLRGEPARTRSDLFAVGLVTYEVGTGEHPFHTPGTSTVQSLHDRIASGPPRDPKELSDSWPADVARVVLRLLSFQGHERLSVGRALADLEGD